GVGLLATSFSGAPLLLAAPFSPSARCGEGAALDGTVAKRRRSPLPFFNVGTRRGGGGLSVQPGRMPKVAASHSCGFKRPLSRCSDARSVSARERRSLTLADAAHSGVTQQQGGSERLRVLRSRLACS